MKPVFQLVDKMRVLVYLLQFLQSSPFLLQFADLVIPLAQVTCHSSHLVVQTLNMPLSIIQLLVSTDTDNI